MSVPTVDGLTQCLKWASYEISHSTFDPDCKDVPVTCIQACVKLSAGLLAWIDSGGEIEFIPPQGTNDD